ncbi:histidine kinase [Epilithonimonas ginsengisoli]|uniref:Histidine kinase n=1 Tax=Epilithonimonas ginsengisoli TaxID=1245592 RepID=A0ABU4JLM8_9FLAO|nr:MULTISPECIES: sensor histidine kinase [Chryseobacterium group]MDW8550443.1 histidine kinase [Epilithonimonas ginsengisoli]
MVSIPVSLLFFVCSRYLLEEVIIYNISGIHNYSAKLLNIRYYVTDNFLFGLPAVILSTLYFLLWQFLAYQRHYQQLQLENQKAQFDMLRSQVSPHFLFNTLNSFYSDWIEKDQKTAADLLTLTNLLRYVITENDKEYVMLSDELDFLKNYVKLQKKRFEDQLFIDFLVTGNCSDHTILPSTLIQLTENLFKYGKLNDPTNRAMINITINDDSLTMVTSNLIVNGENYYSTGTGFKNLKKRLDYAYKENFTFDHDVKNDIFTTVLKITLDNKPWP